MISSENTGSEKPTSFLDLVKYELLSSRIAPWIPFSFLQDIVTKYYVWKTQRKINRYQKRIKLIRQYGKK